MATGQACSNRQRAPLLNDLHSDVQAVAIGARCGAHPEDVAVITCDRCGNFACDGCRRNTKHGRVLCATCYRRYLTIRKEIFDDEQRVRRQSITLYLLGLTAWAVGSWSASLSRKAGHLSLVMAFAATIVGLLFLIAGRGVAKLDRRRRPLVIGLACIALLGFPIGTLLGMQILIGLVRSKGRFVFSDKYREVLDAVPDGEPESKLRRTLYWSVVIWLIAYALSYGLRLLVAS